MEKIGGRCVEFGKKLTDRIWEKNPGLPIDVGIRDSSGTWQEYDDQWYCIN